MKLRNIVYNIIQLFLDRDEIAACLEKSYQRISFKEAQRMLYLDSEKDTKAFAAKVRTIRPRSKDLFL